MVWNTELILTHRLRRQGIIEPLLDCNDEGAYLALFRRLQPQAPVHNTRPGDPPRLMHRTSYNDGELSSELRQRHKLVKGRFQGGRIAYVLEDDLKTYATAFRKFPATFKQIHEDIMIAVQEAGGLSKDQLKDELPYRAPEIGKALQDLQAACLLYEDQIDTDWDTGWLLFAEEWFKVPDDEASKEAAIQTVLLKFTETMVFATERQMKSWSGLPAKTIAKTVSSLIQMGALLPVEVNGLGQGVMCKTDAEQLSLNERKDIEVPEGIYMLDKSDFLVRADLDVLQERFKGLEVLQFLLVDGEFRGAVLGHWGFGDYDLEDIVLDLDEEAATRRQEDVIAAVRKIYSPEHHRIRRYNGVEL